VEKFDNGSDMTGFTSLNTSKRNTVLNLFETVKLPVCKTIIETVTVAKFPVNYKGGNDAGCFEVKVWPNTAKFITDVIVTRLRKCPYSIRKGKVFLLYKTKRYSLTQRADFSIYNITANHMKILRSFINSEDMILY